LFRFSAKTVQNKVRQFADIRNSAGGNTPSLRDGYQVDLNPPFRLNPPFSSIGLAFIVFACNMSEPWDAEASPALFGALVKIPGERAPATDVGLIKRGVGSKIEDLESEFSMLLEMHDRNADENERLRTALEEIAEDRDIEAKNNDLLISLILRLRQPPTPRYEDDYYVFRLQNLNESITSWITAAFKTKEFEQPMSATEEEQLIHLLRKNLPEHIVWLEAIRQRSGITYTALHSKPHSRIALARHLVALSIWRNIFHPLCFGLSGDLKHGVKTVMNSVYTEGTPPPGSFRLIE
jgi:hypothetical protein